MCWSLVFIIFIVNDMIVLIFLLLYFLRLVLGILFFFFSSRRRHTRCLSDWSSDVCSSDLARSLAFGRYAFNKAREHASTRQQFGRPLCEFQGLQWKFADMAIKLEGAQLLLYRAAANADRGLPSAYETAIAKAACNQAGFEAASEAVQIMGAMGYSQESLVEWCMRRCRGWMIAGGSIEILKNRIAEHLFDRRFDQRRPKPAEAAE